MNIINILSTCVWYTLKSKEETPKTGIKLKLLI